MKHKQTRQTCSGESINVNAPFLWYGMVWYGTTIGALRGVEQFESGYF